MNYACQCGSPVRKQTPHSAGLGWPWPDHPACDHSARSSVPNLFWEQQPNLVSQQDQDLVGVSPFLRLKLLVSDRIRSFQSLYGSRNNHPSARYTGCQTEAFPCCHSHHRFHPQERRVPSTLWSIFLRLYCQSLSVSEHILIDPRERGLVNHQLITSSVALFNPRPTCVNDIPLPSLRRNNHRVNIAASHSLRDLI